MSGVNRIVRTISGNTRFPSAVKDISASSTWNQGDLLIWDSSAHIIRLPVSEAEGASMLGISQQTLVAGKLPIPYVTDVDASRAITDIPGPQFGVVASLVLKTGDALNPGDLVYLNPADGAYHVQAAGTKAIGLYAGAAIASAFAGQLIEVLVGCRFPGDALQLS
jgi:hypothetical protein